MVVVDEVVVLLTVLVDTSHCSTAGQLCWFALTSGILCKGWLLEIPLSLTHSTVLSLSRLSSCIFEWDESDVEALLEAKRAELSIAGVPSPSVAAAKPAVRSKELACHCQSRTRESKGQ